MPINSLYLATVGDDLCKIGVSIRPRRRISRLSATQPHKVILRKVWPRAHVFEGEVHSLLAPFRKRGEWFSIKANFAEWVCEEVIADRWPEKAINLYMQAEDCYRASYPREGLAYDEELHWLGWTTDSYLLTKRMAAMDHDDRHSRPY